MRGHILKRSKDSYTIKVALGKDNKTGEYKYKWVSVKGTNKDAERCRSQLPHEVDSGTFIKVNKITMGEYLQRWLKEYAKPNLTPRSYERYESIVRVYLTPCFGNIKLSELKAEHVQRHYSAMHNKGLSALTIRYHHTVIHKLLETAIKWGLLGRNIADSVDVPRSRGNDMQTWDEFEVCRFLDAAKSSRYYALFHTALYTGMRRSELLALQWRNIGIQQMQVQRSLHQLRDRSYVFTQPKSTKSRRTIALSPSSVLVLAEHKER